MKKRILWKRGRIFVAALSLTAAGFSFSGIAVFLTPFLQIQFGPALLNSLTSFSAGSVSAVLILALSTFLFGRFHCAVLCPFGILQDVIGFLSRRKSKPVRNFAAMRYAVAGIVFGLLACGWSTGFLLLDPYSNFGRISGGFTIGGITVLLILTALAIWKKRIFCTALCPVGTLLGLLAKKGLYRLEIEEQCVKCGKCSSVCPGGCINPQTGTIDNERCIRCMNCLAECPLGAIHFKQSIVNLKPVPIDPSRREFLIESGALLAGLAIGVTLAGTGMKRVAEWAKKIQVLPPGAGDSERFTAKCTACQLCAVNCPEKIITAAPGGIGPVSLDLSKGACRFDCNRCSQVCPTGALRKITLAEKQKTKIAEAKFDPTKCIVFQESEPCGKCAAACPVGAITLRKNGTPRPVNPARCIGCGACQAICPAEGKAITVHEIEKQIQLEK